MPQFNYLAPLILILSLAVQPFAYSTTDSALPVESANLQNDLTEQADSLYWQDKYAEALPLYIKRAPLVEDKVVCDSPAGLHYLSDLGDCYCRLGEYTKAQEIYERILASKLKRYGNHSIEIVTDFTNLAACYYYQSQFSKAESLCQQASHIIDKSTNVDPNLVAKTSLEMAEVFYGQGHYEKAQPLYQKAASLFDQSKADVIDLLLISLEGDAACYYHDQNYQKGEPIFRHIAELERSIYGDEDVRYAWALLNLSEIYRKLGKPNQADPLYEKCVYIFRKVNCDRLAAELAQQGNNSQQLKETIYRRVFGNTYEHPPISADSALAQDAQKTIVLQCLPHEQSLAKPGPWNLIVSDRIDPPGWIWLDPSAPPKAVVVCIHGLGLNSRSYDAFARKISAQGFTTVAFDMRGFGSYLSSKGKEHVDFQACLDDLTTLIRGIRRSRTKETSIFILGESMGGAIALQFTAAHPELVDGLICSVPAGSRFKSKSTDLKVAVHLIKGKNIPFDIGTKIINQATTSQQVKQEWETDPFNRLQLSAKELVEFQNFMNQNKSAAAKITNTPAVIFQGMEDKLVKPIGTYEIFKALSTKDKAMVLVGNNEHLIFEADQFDDSTLNGVIGWMEAHRRQIAPSPAKPDSHS